MNKINLEIKKITKLYESCKRCGLPEPNCICNESPNVKTEMKIWILSSERELTRASNTGRILKLSNNDSTEIFIWKRTEEPKELIDRINSGIYDVYLLFPADENNQERIQKLTKSNKLLALIILDGTWNEAKKIYRKSPYLNKLPIVSINPSTSSEFLLRRGIEEGGLCTLEAAIEGLKLNGEFNEVMKIKEFFIKFQNEYKKGQSGHK